MRSYIFEVRHQPNFKLLNVKGDLIELLLGAFGFEKFKNSENGIIVRSEDEKFGAFMLFDRFGISDINPEDFVKKVNKLLDLLNETGLYSKQELLRVGCRITEAEKYDDKIEKLQKSFTKKFGSINEEANKILGMKLVNLKYPMLLKDETCNYKINVGPAQKNEIIELFPTNGISEKDFSEVSVFMDIDCFFVDSEVIDFEKIKSKVNLYFTNISEKMNSIREYVLSER